MSQWIFVDLGPFVDENTSVLEKLSIHYASLEHSQLIQRKRQNSPQIIFFDASRGEQYLKEQILYLKKRDLVFLVLDSSTLLGDREGEINQFLLNSNRVKGVIDCSLGRGVVHSQLSGIKEISDLLFEIDTDEEYLNDFQQRLDELSQNMLLQLERVKKLHRKLVPRKELQIGKLKTICKYVAGDSEHSEFWDVTRTDGHQLTLLLSTENSGALIRVLDRIVTFLGQKECDTRDLKVFHEYLKENIQGRFSLFMMLTRIADMSSILVSEGHLLLFVNGTSLTTLKNGVFTKMQLREGDKFCIISSGIIKNYEKEFKYNNLLQTLQNEWQLPTHDFIQQIFLEAKVNKAGRFHYYDGTSIILEVMK